MEATLSTKYQLVIPKAARRKLNYKPGDKLTVTTVGNEVRITKSLSAIDLVTKYAGSLKNTEWAKAGLTPVEWIRKQRDTEWR